MREREREKAEETFKREGEREKRQKACQRSKKERAESNKTINRSVMTSRHGGHADPERQQMEGNGREGGEERGEESGGHRNQQHKCPPSLSLSPALSYLSLFHSQKEIRSDVMPVEWEGVRKGSGGGAEK